MTLPRTLSLHALLALSSFLLMAGCDDGGSASDGGEGEGEEGEGEGEEGEGEGEAEAPTVLFNSPSTGAVGVTRNARIAVTFSELMDPASFAGATFTLRSSAGVVVGTVTPLNASVEFVPADLLAANTTFTATMGTAATSVAGPGLAQPFTWSFTTGGALSPTVLPVDTASAGTFVILAKTAISTVPPSAVTGNIAVSPAAATFITGFSLTADPTNVFSTSPQVTGQVFAADFAVPTPDTLTTAVSDMELAYTDAAGRAPDLIELGAGNIGNLTLVPGVYAWSSGLDVPAATTVTLNGGATDVWIFQVAGNFTMASGTAIVLQGGALAKNVFWQVAGAVEIRTTAHVEGIVLTQTAVTMQTGSSINGRLLAQTAVSLDASTVVQPSP